MNDYERELGKEYSRPERRAENREALTPLENFYREIERLAIEDKDHLYFSPSFMARELNETDRKMYEDCKVGTLDSAELQMRAEDIDNVLNEHQKGFLHYLKNTMQKEPGGAKVDNPNDPRRG